MGNSNSNNKNASEQKCCSSKPKKHIALFGGTGGTGLSFLSQAVEKGHKVTALVRQVDKVPEELRNNPAVTLVEGNSLDPEKVTQVVKGAESVVISLGSSSGKEEDKKVCSESQPIINAAVNAECPQAKVVAVTSLGVGDSYDHITLFTKLAVNTILARPIEDKNVQEASLKADVENYTIVRPGGLTNDPPTGQWEASETVGGGRIARADVAKFILEQCLDCGDRCMFVKKAVSIVGK
mmetsp:Transcript_20283/g.24232  ORF Transcript_20283/g.24232 Transcript_20283/m.24232 type:complete len:238 (+) Transcript_20283:196-909(+)|eukprot:CAMPEP_0197857774 /NCGR_PEP_ID=MMETSP1438-20131217/31141_1 /TAXON_ID=1461541 /ORGANISM="Pterosperma sp., Strain CCMP1384" /LENGTH=237 /DNA_ID=CAMNT_0043473729 /DNA_START=192 /DNA_END=905 /DNA_ORIENTATION=-